MQFSSVVNRVFAYILLNKNKFSLICNITQNSELTDFIISLALNFVLEDIHVIKAHFLLIAVLHIITSPTLWHSGDREIARLASDVPCA